jgi:hypothetical protein
LMCLVIGGLMFGSVAYAIEPQCCKLAIVFVIAPLVCNFAPCRHTSNLKSSLTCIPLQTITCFGLAVYKLYAFT